MKMMMTMTMNHDSSSRYSSWSCCVFRYLLVLFCFISTTVTTVAFQSSDLSLQVPVLPSSSASSASACRRRNIESQLFQTKEEVEAKQLRNNNKIEKAAIQRFTIGYNKLCKNCPTRLQPRVETITEMIMGLSKDDRNDLLAAVSQRQQQERETDDADRSKTTPEERRRRNRREYSSGLRTPEEVYHFQMTGDGTFNHNVNVNHSSTSSSSIQQFQKSLIRNEIEWEEKEDTPNNQKKSSSSVVVESNETKGTYHTTTTNEERQQRIIVTNSNNSDKKKKKQQKIIVKMDKNKVKLRKSKIKLMKINSLLKVVTLLLASSSSSSSSNNNNNNNNNKNKNSKQQISSVRDNTIVSFHDDIKNGYENNNNEHNDDDDENEEIQKLYLMSRSELKLQYLQYTSQKMKYERSRAKSRVKCYSASLQLLSKR